MGWGVTGEVGDEEEEDEWSVYSEEEGKESE